GDTLSISLTLDSPPTAAKAVACSHAPGVVTGGIWSAEFWAASQGNTEGYGESFYIGYRDNPPNGAPGGEAGMINNVNPTITSLEYNPTRPATVGGTCFATTPPAPGRDRSLRVGAVVAVALAVAFVVWLLVRDNGTSSSKPTVASRTKTTTQGRKVKPLLEAASVQTLKTLATVLGHPIYWAGARS